MNEKCIFCFRVLSAKSRFSIFSFLKSQKDKINIRKIVEFVSLSQPTVTFHVNRLAKAGLVRKTKIGRAVYCQINDKCPMCFIFN